MAAPKSKEEYLKRYLGANSAKSKAKKAKKVARLKLLPRSKIVDDDIDIKSVVSKDGEDYDIEYGEDAPQIAGVVDERPEDVQKMEEFSKKKKWRVLGASEDEDDNASNDDKSSNGSSKKHPQQVGRWNSNVILKEKFVSSSATLAPDDGADGHSRRRHDSADSDKSQNSKPTRHDSGSDESPPRRSRCDSGSDQSPPRTTRVKSEKTDSLRRSSEAGQAAPRKSRQRRRSSGSDQSPPRKNDLKKKIKTEPADSGSDQSPPRRSMSREPKLMRKTLDGKRAGLQDAATLRRENEAARRRENRLFERAGDETLGRHAETVVRDRASGKRRDFKAEEQKKQEAAALKEAREAKYKQWNKGLKQTDMQKERLESDLREISKPLARYEDDEDLDKHLRDQERVGDPMLAFIKKKKKVAAGLDPDKVVPRYSGPPGPPNRYGIDPGYRWDGVDRSNGYEKSRFMRQNDRKARLEQAYKWSVEDM